MFKADYIAHKNNILTQIQDDPGPVVSETGDKIKTLKISVQ